ncbi:hypothetical protein ACSS6W_000659 [Trichoderma asperelloides]|nr:hypothetical protein LI328DRAFT_170682 [Trichoderma asperelloides]
MFDGALVEFDAGARVTKIRFQCDFSAVRIRGFPKSTTEQLVRDMLEEVGFGDCVEEIHMTDVGRNCEATVIADSPSFAKQLCERIVPGFTWRDMSIKAWSIAALVPRAFKNRQVDCRKVTVSWPKPGREVILSFGSLTIADRVFKMFNEGRCRVLGQRVAAAMAPAPGPDEAPPPSRLAFKVMLTELPLVVREVDVKRAVENGPRPRQIVTRGYTASAGETFSAVHSLLTAIGPLESFDTIDDPADNKLKVVACFLGRSDALKAAKQLDKAAPSFHPDGRLSVRAVYTVRFAVDKRVYDVMWRKLVTVTSEQSILKFGCHSVDSAIRVFHVEGESALDVAETKNKVESILASAVVEEDGVALWHPSLRADGLLYDKMTDLEEQLGVVIARDQVRCNLCVFGSNEACHEAKGKLVELVRRELGTDISRSIALKDRGCYWRTNKGFQELVNAVGHEKLWLSLAFPSKVIEMKGTVEEYDLTRAIIAGESEVSTTLQYLKMKKSVSFATFQAKTMSKLPITYYSSKRAMSIADQRKHLSSKMFEQVLKERFLDYVKHSLGQFRSCPTPDCGYIYRTTGTECPEWHTCSNCLKTTCSVCHEQHLEMQKG